MKTLTNYLSAALFFCVVIFGCNKQKNSGDQYKDSREIYDEALKIHDEVMPKMGTIMQLQKSLKTNKESLTDKTVLNQVDSALNALDNAYDQMMKWMRNLPRIPEYDPTGKSNELSAEPSPDPEEMKEFQLKSLEDIKKVKADVNESIKNAEEILESLNEV